MTEQITEQLIQAGHNWLNQLPLEWQNWLTENLERGCAPEELLHILKQNGFDLSLTLNNTDEVTTDRMANETVLGDSQEDHIINLLLHGLSPFEVTRQTYDESKTNLNFEHYAAHIDQLYQSTLFRRLQKEHHLRKKREWLISTLDQLQQLSAVNYTTINRIKTPKFKDFIVQYYSQHHPVIITDGIKHWPALNKWTPEYFAEVVGDQLVEVQMGRNQVQDFERKSTLLKQMIPMKAFVEKVLNAGASNDFYLTANNAQNSKSAVTKLYGDIADFGKGYCNVAQQNSLSFIWFGPKGTFTPLHHDLTNNMLVQIYGRKKVTLVPALQTPHLYNDRWVFSEISNLEDVDLKRYTEFKHVTRISLVLEPGEALFIPIGWWHTVESLDVSISVSFTHFNAPNHFSQTFPKAYNE